MAQVNFQGHLIHEDLVETLRAVTTMMVPNAANMEYHIFPDNLLLILWHDGNGVVVEEYINQFDTPALLQEAKRVLQALLGLPFTELIHP